MYLSIPIISFDINYNRETTENKAYSYFKNSADLIKALENINLENLAISKIEAFMIAERRYKWEYITNKYFKTF
jgi:glycosyltransferase involved in cell wall biosynthesis